MKEEDRSIQLKLGIYRGSITDDHVLLKVGLSGCKVTTVGKPTHNVVNIFPNWIYLTMVAVAV
jgi:hypothetical protein